MARRRCKCGCTRSMSGKHPDALYATDACRTRDWKVRNGYKRGNGRNGSLKRRKPRSRPPELRISYHKALDATAQQLDGCLGIGDTEARRLAMETLQPLLSPKARARAEEVGHGR